MCNRSWKPSIFITCSLEAATCSLAILRSILKSAKNKWHQKDYWLKHCKLCEYLWRAENKEHRNSKLTLYSFSITAYLQSRNLICWNFLLQFKFNKRFLSRMCWTWKLVSKLWSLATTHSVYETLWKYYTVKPISQFPWEISPTGYRLFEMWFDMIWHKYIFTHLGLADIVCG